MNLGESMVSIAANNAADKLLEEEDLALFQLIKDIEKNDQVLYAVITNQANVIKAHRSMDELNRPFGVPQGASFIKEVNEVKISAFDYGGTDALFFQRPVTYHDIHVGSVYLAITQMRIKENIRDATRSILLLTVFITGFGILLSFLLGMYFSRPITRIREGALAVGKGDFSHSVDIRRNDELGDLGEAFNRMASGLSERERIRETFGKYVTPEIRDEILSGRIPLDGERRIATVLFADLRDFTPYVEDTSPEEVIKGLRDYFTAMQEAIRIHDGLVLQYVGDQLEAIFGVPLYCEDHAEKALKAALEMRRHLEVLNRERVSQGLRPFRHGVGIHTGEVLAGNSGSNDQLTYTLIGDTVNLASRIQNLTKTFLVDILVSQETIQGVRQPFPLKELPPQMVKGYSRPVVLYQISDPLT